MNKKFPPFDFRAYRKRLNKYQEKLLEEEILRSDFDQVDQTGEQGGKSSTASASSAGGGDDGGGGGPAEEPWLFETAPEPDPTPPPTPTSSITPSISITPAASVTPTTSITPSVTTTPAASVTPTSSISPSVTTTPSSSISPSVTTTPSVTATPAASVTPTSSITPSVSITPTTSITPTSSVTPSVTTTPTSSISPSVTTTPAPSVTPTSSISPSVTTTPAPSVTPTSSISPSVTTTPAPSVTPSPSSIASWLQLGGDIDGEAAGDYSGHSVSLNDAGTIVAIGAIHNDDNGTDSGHTRIYQWSGSAWTQMGNDIVGEAAGDWGGYSVSLNDAGTIVAIGAIFNGGNGTVSGHTRIYQWNGTAWTKMGNDIDGEAVNDYSGYSVSLNDAGTIVAIGAIRNDGVNGTDSGHVRVYEWVNNAWTQMGLDIDGEAAGDQSGYSVSLNAAGTIVAIGANSNDGNGTDSGHVKIYEWVNNAWTQKGSDIDGEAAGDWGGYSVSLNAAGTIVAIGAPGNDGNGTGSGHTRIYQWNGAAWTQMGNDIDGEAAGDFSGSSVSLNDAGTIVAIGARSNFGNGYLSGHTRIYQWSGSAWTQIALDIDGEAVNDRSGYSVSLNDAGTIVAIGAFYNDGNGTDSGHVRVYRIPTAPVPSATPTPTPTPTPSTSQASSGNYTETLNLSINGGGAITMTPYTTLINGKTVWAGSSGYYYYIYWDTDRWYLGRNGTNTATDARHFSFSTGGPWLGTWSPMVGVYGETITVSLA